MKPIFNDEQLKRASLILESPLAKLSELYSNEIKDQRKNLRVFFFKHTTSSVYIKRMPYLLPL